MNAFHAHIQVPRHLIMSTETFQYLKKPKTRNICVTQHLGRWLFDLYLVSASFPKPPGLFFRRDLFLFMCMCVYVNKSMLTGVWVPKEARKDSHILWSSSYSCEQPDVGPGRTV